MYESFYELAERPFSITPNPRFVYLSQRHQDALAHLLYGMGTGGSGGFVQLTGEVGTGKTTLCRLVLEQVPENTRVALILNPMLEPAELLRAICTELEIDTDDLGPSIQALQDRLNRYLLERHGAGERVVLIIDEAQNMSREALEQIRLLTNLETATDKLLQIILLGQPELRRLLARPELRQLAQRITARFHLDPLERPESDEYVRHRLGVAGALECPFTRGGLKALFEASGGVPRLINIIADRALVAGYARGAEQVDGRLVRAAADEVAGESQTSGGWLRGLVASTAVVLVFATGGLLSWMVLEAGESGQSTSRAAWVGMLEDTSAESAWREIAGAWPGLDHRDVAEACESGHRGGVACLSLRGSLAYIERIGVPAVLNLREPDGAHALMVGRDGNQLILRHKGQDYHAPLTQIEHRWLGDFFVAWPDSGRIMSVGDSGPEVARLKELAAEVAEPAWTGAMDDRYDEAFADWVRRFQRQNDLNQDGVVGPATRLFLKVPHLDGPSLFRNHDGV